MKRLLFLFTCLLIGVFCQKGPNNPDPLPPAPDLIRTLPDTSIIEGGIDAIPEYDAIRIEWIDRPIYEKYALYRKAANEDVFLLLHFSPAGDSAFTDMINISLNTRYYYYLKGMDENGNWSAPSDTLNYLLIPKVNNLVYSTSDSSFYWSRQEIPPRSFIVKLFTKADNRLVWRCQIEPIYHQSVQYVKFNVDGTAKQQLQSGIWYIWRIDSVGPAQNSGSESGWNSFKPDVNFYL
ncbi:hypothetical protein JW935_07630 [candidate division KSB1 bacterium]|nr:hypothetical protein [candidate division KSB1 bacterium]